MSFSLAHKYCSQLPWCNTNPDDLGPIVMEFCRDHESYMRRWAQKWFENFQFIYGNQHLRWSRRYDVAVDVDFLRKNKSVNHKSQTNISRTVLESLGSMIFSGAPTWDTNTADEGYVQGKRFSAITKKLLECYYARVNCESEFKKASTVFAAYGQCALKIERSPIAGRIREFPKLKKVKQPIYTSTMVENDPFGLMEVPTQAVNAMGEPMFEDRWVPATDFKGNPIIERKFTGDVRVKALTPFQYRREPGSSGMHDTKWVQEFELLDYDEYLKIYGEMDGKTPLFQTVKPGNMAATVQEFAMKQYVRMNFTSPISSDDLHKRTEALRLNLFRHKVFVVVHYDRPDAEMWEKGRRLVITNGVCTHINTPDYSTNKLDGWHPFTEAQWLNVAPSSMATGPMNDVIDKNRDMNTMDSLIMTSIHRNFGSALLVKSGDSLDPQQITGDPGQIFEVNDPQGVARYLRDDQPISPVISSLRDSKKDDVFEISGAGDALRGERSKGVSAGYALRQLQEREEKRLTPARKEFEKMIASAGEKLIACVKQTISVELDRDVMGFMKRSAAGEFSEQDVIAFLKTPIDFGVDVNVEPGSMLYKSKATQQATLLDLAKGPAAQRLQQNAKVLDNFLKFFDAETLRDASAIHRDTAHRENEVFTDIGKMGPEAKGVNMPVVIFEDDDDIHMEEHIEDLLNRKDAILSNPFEYQMRVYHIEWHRAQKREKMGELPPGTALQLPAQFANAQKNAPRPLGLIYQNKMAMDEQKAQQEQQAQAQQTPTPDQRQASQAPREPAPPGAPGPGPQNPQAPADNTQTAKSAVGAV